MKGDYDDSAITTGVLVLQAGSSTRLSTRGSFPTPVLDEICV